MLHAHMLLLAIMILIILSINALCIFFLLLFLNWCKLGNPLNIFFKIDCTLKWWYWSWGEQDSFNETSQPQVCPDNNEHIPSLQRALIFSSLKWMNDTTITGFWWLDVIRHMKLLRHRRCSVEVSFLPFGADQSARKTSGVGLPGAPSEALVCFPFPTLLLSCRCLAE